MISLYVNKNIVWLDKQECGEEYSNFVEQYLVKFEEVLQVDPFRSNRYKKKFKSVLERRELYTETEEKVLFSRGLLEFIPSDAPVTIVDVSSPNEIITPELTDDEIKTTLDCFDLRADQILAVKKGLIAKRGVLQLPTATGKSSILTSIVKRLHEKNPYMNSLVLAPTLSTVKNINDTLEAGGLDTGIFDDKKGITTSVTTSHVQSLLSSRNKEQLKDINAVFYDECLPSQAKVLLSDFRKVSIIEVYANSDIKEVLAYNVETHTYEPKKIIHKYRTPYNERFCRVYYKHPTTDRIEGLSCTMNHKIYTKRGYIPAGELTKDDEILIDIPTVRNVPLFYGKTFAHVTHVRQNVGKKGTYKYNLEIEDYHNYFADDVLVSNCHHLQCDTWNKLNMLLPNVEYSLGFSALAIDKSEIFETDIRNLSYNAALITGCSGRVLMHMDPSYYIERGIIALPILFRVKHQVELPDNFDESNWARLNKVGLMSDERAEKIARIANMFSKYKRKTLILVSEKAYAFKIGDLLAQKYDNTNFGISFGAGVGYVCNPADPNFYKKTAYKAKNSLEVLDMLEEEGGLDIIIASTHVDEGVDVKGLDACILAGAGKKDRKVIQRVGRVLRKSKNGKYAYIVDFTDDNSRILSRQSQQRFDIYKNDIGVPESNISDGVDINDIENKFRRLENIS